MKSSGKLLILYCFLLFLALFPAASTSRADQIAIGLVSYDVFQPGQNTISINNFTGNPATGGNALPPDFNVFTSLNITNASLTLFGPSAPSNPISLGTIGSGPLLDGLGNPLTSLLFDSASNFTSAILTGTLDFTNVTLADGSTLQLNSNISFTLSPASGNFLVAGTDFGIIYADTAPVATPEPSIALLILFGLLAFLASKRISLAKSRVSSSALPFLSSLD